MPPSHPLTPFPWLDVLVILMLIALNGVFAMAELAIVSSRKPRLKAMAKNGRRGAQTALDLAADRGSRNLALAGVRIGDAGGGCEERRHGGGREDAIMDTHTEGPFPNGNMWGWRPNRRPAPLVPIPVRMEPAMP